MFKTIIVAVDGSDHAENALRMACDIAQKYDADLHLVHTPELDTTALAVGSGAFAIEPDKEQVAAAGKFVMDKATETARQHKCVPAECVIGNGDPAHEILQQAEKTDADLIVTGRRGLGRVSSLLLGSVSQKVSHDSPCACLTVK